MPNEITKDYVPTKEAKGEEVKYTSNGKINAIDALYTEYSQAGVWNNSD